MFAYLDSIKPSEKLRIPICKGNEPFFQINKEMPHRAAVEYLILVFSIPFSYWNFLVGS
jgi:hypothetical protein